MIIKLLLIQFLPIGTVEKLQFLLLQFFTNLVHVVIHHFSVGHAKNLLQHLRIIAMLFQKRIKYLLLARRPFVLSDYLLWLFHWRYCVTCPWTSPGMYWVACPWTNYRWFRWRRWRHSITYLREVILICVASLFIGGLHLRVFGTVIIVPHRTVWLYMAKCDRSAFIRRIRGYLRHKWIVSHSQGILGRISSR